MGVTGLWRLLMPCGRRISIETLEGQILAIDASIWLTQFVTVAAAQREREENNEGGHHLFGGGDSHTTNKKKTAYSYEYLVGFLRRLCKLRYHGVRPVLVFDGATPDIKRREVRQRLQRRRKRTVGGGESLYLGGRPGEGTDAAGAAAAIEAARRAAKRIVAQQIQRGTLTTTTTATKSHKKRKRTTTTAAEAEAEQKNTTNTTTRQGASYADGFYDPTATAQEPHNTGTEQHPQPVIGKATPNSVNAKKKKGHEEDEGEDDDDHLLQDDYNHIATGNAAAEAEGNDWENAIVIPDEDDHDDNDDSSHEDDEKTETEKHAKSKHPTTPHFSTRQRRDRRRKLAPTIVPFSETTVFHAGDGTDFAVATVADLAEAQRKDIIEEARKQRRLASRREFLAVASDPTGLSTCQVRNFLKATRLNQDIAKMAQQAATKAERDAREQEEEEEETTNASSSTTTTGRRRRNRIIFEKDTVDTGTTNTNHPTTRNYHHNTNNTANPPTTKKKGRGKFSEEIRQIFQHRDQRQQRHDQNTTSNTTDITRTSVDDRRSVVHRATNNYYLSGGIRCSNNNNNNTNDDDGNDEYEYKEYNDTENTFVFEGEDEDDNDNDNEDDDNSNNTIEIINIDSSSTEENNSSNDDDDDDNDDDRKALPVKRKKHNQIAQDEALARALQNIEEDERNDEDDDENGSDVEIVGCYDNEGRECSNDHQEDTETDINSYHKKSASSLSLRQEQKDALLAQKLQKAEYDDDDEEEFHEGGGFCTIQTKQLPVLPLSLKGTKQSNVMYQDDDTKAKENKEEVSDSEASDDDGEGIDWEDGDNNEKVVSAENGTNAPEEERQRSGNKKGEEPNDCLGFDDPVTGNNNSNFLVTASQDDNNKFKENKEKIVDSETSDDDEEINWEDGDTNEKLVSSENNTNTDEATKNSMNTDGMIIDRLKIAIKRSTPTIDDDGDSDEINWEDGNQMDDSSSRTVSEKLLSVKEAQNDDELKLFVKNHNMNRGSAINVANVEGNDEEGEVEWEKGDTIDHVHSSLKKAPYETGQENTDTDQEITGNFEGVVDVKPLLTPCKPLDGDVVDKEEKRAEAYFSNNNARTQPDLFSNDDDDWETLVPKSKDSEEVFAALEHAQTTAENLTDWAGRAFRRAIAQHAVDSGIKVPESAKPGVLKNKSSNKDDSKDDDDDDDNNDDDDDDDDDDEVMTVNIKTAPRDTITSSLEDSTQLSSEQSSNKRKDTTSQKVDNSAWLQSVDKEYPPGIHDETNQVDGMLDPSPAGGINEEMRSEVMQLLRLFGLPFVVAPAEAEAQCVMLEKLGLVDGIVSEDSDTFVFGGQVVYKNIFEDKKYVEVYHAKDASEEMSLTQDALVALAMLLGGDYTEGVKGVGIVNGTEIVKAFDVSHNCKDGLTRFRKWLDGFDPNDLVKTKKRKNTTTKDSTDDTSMALNKEKIFHKKHYTARTRWIAPKNFPDAKVMNAYFKPVVDTSRERFTFGVPDIDGLVDFCCKHMNWSPEETHRAILPVIKKMEESSMRQTRIDSFMRYEEGIKFANVQSKRLREVFGWSTQEIDKKDRAKPEKLVKSSSAYNDKNNREELFTTVNADIIHNTPSTFSCGKEESTANYTERNSNNERGRDPSHPVQQKRYNGKRTRSIAALSTASRSTTEIANSSILDNDANEDSTGILPSSAQHYNRNQRAGNKTKSAPPAYQKRSSVITGEEKDEVKSNKNLVTAKYKVTNPSMTI